jgi:hypothetical protein
MADRASSGGSRRARTAGRGEELPWVVVYCRTQEGKSPGLDFLDACPGKIDAQFTAVLDAVAAAPPPRFSGGGKWEAMHDDMAG